MNLEIITQHLEIGEPVIFNEEVFGRIVAFSSKGMPSPYGEEYSVVIFCTPAGTEIETGRVWLQKIVSAEELKTLMQFEQLVLDRNSELYNSKLDDINYKSFDKKIMGSARTKTIVTIKNTTGKRKKDN